VRKRLRGRAGGKNMDKATVLQSGRMVWIDHLRVLATFAVVVLHAAARNWYSADVHGFEWRVLNIYNGFVRWGVPVFIMISGALFLNRDIPVRQLYGRLGLDTMPLNPILSLRVSMGG